MGTVHIRVEYGQGWVGDHAELLVKVANAIGYTVSEDYSGDDLIAAPGSLGSKVWSDWMTRRRARQGPNEPLLERRKPQGKGWGAPEREANPDLRTPELVAPRRLPGIRPTERELYRELDRDGVPVEREGSYPTIAYWGKVAQEQRSCSYERWSIWSCDINEDSSGVIPYIETMERVCPAETEFLDCGRLRIHRAYCERRLDHAGRHLDFDPDTGCIKAVWP